MGANNSVTMIGLGGMGGALARAVVSRAHQVTVWNRTKERAAPLVAAGAALAETPAQAFAASELVIMCVLDGDTAMGILNEAGVADAIKGKTLVQLSTCTPEQIKDQQAWVQARGGRFIAGGIVAYPRSIGRPSALIVYGGDPCFEQYRAMLTSLGSSPHYLGADPCLVTGAYFTLSTFMIGTLGLFYETAALARHYGVNIDDFYLMARLANDEVLDGIRDGAQRIARGQYEGDQASLDLHLAGMQYVSDTYKPTGIPALMNDALVAVLKLACEQGDGAKDLSALTEALWARRAR